MDGLVFTCQIGRLPVTTFQVKNFSLSECLSQLFHLELSVISTTNNIPLSEQLDREASLMIIRDGVIERTVNGIVAGVRQGNTDGRLTEYQFILKPEMWRMTLNQNSRIFQKLPVPDILKSLLKEHRIKSDCKLYEEASEGHHLLREYTTQKRESAYEFWCRLAAEEGIAFWFEEDKLFYSDSHLGKTAGLSLTYNPQPNMDDTDTTVWQWQYGEYLCPDEFIGKDYNPLRPGQPMQTRMTLEQGGDYSVYESYGRFQWSKKEGGAFGELRLNQLNNESKSGSAQTNCIKVRPGKIFQLNAHPSDAMNVRWQIISVTHYGSQPQAAGTEGEGTTLTNNIAFIPDEQDWRPPFRYKPMADGDELATVVGPKGEEIFVNENGEIKVHFHWNRYDEAGDSSSCWVRVAQGWNGDGFGFMAIPRIGQEVIVSYLNGDIDRPIVTGCNYNGRNRPPLDLPAEKTRTTFKTRTHKGEGFNELRFEDAKGSEEVFIHAQKDIKTQVLNDETSNIGHNRIHHIKNNAHLRVENEYRIWTGKDISLSTGQKLHIKTDDALLTQSSNEIHLRSGAKIVIDAGSELTIQAAGHFLKIDAGGISSSAAINFGSGAPGKGSGWGGQLPDMLDKLKQINVAPAEKILVKTPEKICISCLMKAASEGAAMVIRGQS
ncbi:conserved hypothetical protein [Xenorhabdus nematophila str. Anatoliense]|nr:conserved hypothetical protein [Xenorhabdus nematophila str. Anatoliense]